MRLPGSSRVGQGPVGVELTLPEVTQVEQLVVPLCENAQRVLDEGHHDQEATDRGEVPETSEHGVSACLEIPCLGAIWSSQLELQSHHGVIPDEW